MIMDPLKVFLGIGGGSVYCLIFFDWEGWIGGNFRAIVLGNKLEENLELLFSFLF